MIRSSCARLCSLLLLFTATACSPFPTCTGKDSTPKRDSTAPQDDLRDAASRKRKNNAQPASPDASVKKQQPNNTDQRRHLRAAKRALMLQREEDALRRFGDVLETGDWSDAQLQAVTHLVQLLIERDRADRALTLLKNQVPDSARDLESLQILRARAESAAGNLNRAIELYTALLEDNPRRLVLYPRIAALYERTDQPENAAQTRADLDTQVSKIATQLDAQKTSAPDKVALLQTLSQISTPDARKAATDALTASSPDVQIAAARTLGDMGAREALPELRALRDRTSEPQVKSAVASALRQLR